MIDRKQNAFKPPDTRKLQEVIIDHRTRIYIALDADPQKARERYFSRFETKKA